MSKPELVEAIRDEIHGSGPIPFARFMAHALYHPQYGYYTAVDAGERIGRAGDYYTSSGVHPIFGALIAKQLLQMASHLALTAGAPLTVVEVGAGKGALCQDILRGIQQVSPTDFQRLCYVIVEKSPWMRARQEERLAGPLGDRVRWDDRIPDGLVGVILSNELMDAFPVHRLRVGRGSLEEMWVDWKAGHFCGIWAAPSSPALAQWVHGIGPWDTPVEIEANLLASDFLRAAAGALSQGFVVTIDYGHPAEALYGPWRPRGTFLCYFKHTANENPFERVGEQDMTAHVNFTALMRAGDEAGLSCLGLTDQTRFLMGLGITEAMERSAARMDASEAARREFLAMKHLMAPREMGGTFKVLIQGKGVPANLALDGLRFRPLAAGAI